MKADQIRKVFQLMLAEATHRSREKYPSRMVLGLEILPTGISIVHPSYKREISGFTVHADISEVLIPWTEVADYCKALEM